jgi:hypothetical protein
MKNQAKCPKCGTVIDVEKALYSQVSQELEKTMEASIETRLSKEKSTWEKKKTEEQKLALKAIQEELDKKSEQLKTYYRVSAENERLKREMVEVEEKIKAESEVRYSKLLAKEREKSGKAAEEKNQLKIAEKQHVIDQLHEKLKDAQRKISQGSMQTQGEVQELAIEEYLRASFPLDDVVEVKKGARGSDCLIHVNTRLKNRCGIISVESKRTKEFSIGWLEKFRADMRENGAVSGVLVTDILPKGQERMCQLEGIWVCTFEEFKGLIHVLRESIILLDSAISSQVNKADKMHVLYDYLTGREFRGHIEGIVEGFMSMRNDLDGERRSMEAIWKKREKQISKVVSNTAHMYGSLRGIAGIAGVNGLELPA